MNHYELSHHYNCDKCFKVKVQSALRRMASVLHCGRIHPQNRRNKSQSSLKRSTYYQDKLYDSPFLGQQRYRWYHNNGKAFRKLWARDKLRIKFCYCKDDKESLDCSPHLLITHIPHKKKRISIKILCTCVASQLFTKHDGSDIYFLYLILLDSQFVRLNKMCTGTLNIAFQIFYEYSFIVYCGIFTKVRCAHTSSEHMSICHLELPININSSN